MKAVNRLIPLPHMVVLAAVFLGSACQRHAGFSGARAWGVKPRDAGDPMEFAGRRSSHPAPEPRSAESAAALPVPNPYYRNRTPHTTSRRRQEILRKLKTITFDRIDYPGVPLGEVVRHLNEETKRLDPEKKGVNFMLLSPTATSEASVQDLVNAPAGPGDPFAPPAGAAGVRLDAADLENVTVNIDPPLSDLPLVHVLDAITKKADTLIQFAVTDYAVVIWPRTPRDADRFFRTFRSSPGAFQQGLEGVQGVPMTGVGAAQ